MIGCQELEATFHLSDRIAKRIGRQLCFGDDRGKQMRNAFVHPKLNTLRIDQNHPNLLWRRLEEDAHDHGIDSNRLA